MTEAQTQRLIMDWLQAKGILAFRMNTGAMSGEHKGKKWFMRFGVPGMADILAFPFCSTSLEQCPAWIEVKGPKGKQSEFQKSFQQQVEIHGHRYILAYSLDDVIKAL